MHAITAAAGDFDALQVKAVIKEAFDEAFQKYDLLLTPVAPTTAYKIGEKTADPLQMYLGDVYTVPVSHGEGRFVADEQTLQTLKANGQIATQYVDLAKNPSDDTTFNPNGSVWAIEGITSLDGRVFGKMAHSERRGNCVIKNVPGEKDQRIFESGVAYFD